MTTEANTPTTEAGRRLVADILEALRGLDLDPETRIVQLVTSGVILAEKEKAAEVLRQVTGDPG